MKEVKYTVIGFWGAYPELSSATSCYLIEKDGFSLLLDCGSGALAQLPNYIDAMQLDAVVISHYHQDHIADIGVLQYYWLVQNQIHATKKVLPIYGHTKDRVAFAKLDHQATKGVGYHENSSITIGPFTIDFLETRHPVACYAIRVTDGTSTIVYTADSSYQDTFIPFVYKADLLIGDCSFYQGQDGSVAGHMTSEQVAILAEKAQVKHLLLSHLPHFGDRQQLKYEAMQFYCGKVDLASEGFSWQFNEG